MKTKKYQLTKIIISLLFITFFLGVVIYIGIDMESQLKDSITHHTYEPMREYIDQYGFWGMFFIILMNAAQVNLTFMPAEPIQILSGITYEPWLAFLLCLTGVVLGNIVIYVLSRRAKDIYRYFYHNKRNSVIQEVATVEKPSKLTYLILCLYFLPAIPYGMIAYLAASSKISFKRYLLITTIGVIPSIVLSLILGNTIIMSNKIVAIVIASILVVLLVLSLIFFKPLVNRLLGKAKDKTNMQIYYDSVHRPNSFVYYLIGYIVKIFYFPFRKIKVIKKDIPKIIDRPALILYNHASKLDFMYATVPLLPNRINMMTAYFYFCNYSLGNLLNVMGAYPKQLYSPDIGAIKNTFKIIHQNGIIGMAPEGRLSPHGTLETINPATTKLIKKLAVDIYISKIEGSYLTFPKWAKHSRKGKITITFSKLVSASEVINLSEDEIQVLITKALSYDEFEYLKKNNYTYKGKGFAEGLEYILYRCPVCHELYTYNTKNNHLECSNCHTSITLNNQYTFISNQKLPENIKEWYMWQKDYERNHLLSDDFIKSNVILKIPDPKGKWFKEVGKGITVLDKTGLTYTGTMNGEDVKLYFDINTHPTILFGANEDFEVYSNNNFYYFVPENIKECVRYCICAEIFKERLDNDRE